MCEEKQMTIDDLLGIESEQIAFSQPIVKVLKDDLVGLTPRQKALHTFLVDYQKTYNERPTDMQIVMNIDDEWYGFYKEIERKGLTDREAKLKFNDLTCRRNLTDDKEALEFHMGTRNVFIGNGYAVSDWQIRKQILKYEIQGKKAFKKKTICIMKGLKNNQLSFDYDEHTKFNKIKMYQSKLDCIDKEIENLQIEIKEGDKNETQKESK